MIHKSERIRLTSKEKRMRPGMRAVPRVVLILIISFTAALIMAEEITKNITSAILESFDQPDTASWIVQGSKFATKDFPQMSLVRVWPDALMGKNKENKDYYALGVHAKFDRMAYNYIEIIPAKKGSDGKLVQSTLSIPGRARSIDLWVWGANFNYYMEAHVRDFQGVDHVLPLGDLKFIGWRNLSADIPGSIPQSRNTIPKYQGLEITEFVVWTRPTEKVDDFYVFLDQVKVLTDLFETRFDGDNLADTETLNDLWKAGAQAGK
jgi:hypothetical protein